MKHKEAQHYRAEILETISKNAEKFIPYKLADEDRNDEAGFYLNLKNRVNKTVSFQLFFLF
jgi:hypothetical protein